MEELWSEEICHKINPRVLKCGYYRVGPGWRSPLRHDVKTYFDLLYVTEGCGEFKINGKWCEYRAGDLLTIKPGESFQQDRTGTDPFCASVLFILPFGDKPGKCDKQLARLWPRKMSFQTHPILEDYFNQAIELFTTKPEGYVLNLKRITLLILEAVIRGTRHKTHDRITPMISNVARAHQYIENHYQEELTLEQIAENCEMSASYLTVLFHRHYQASPIDYLIEYRLRMAKLLLAKGLSVSQTAGRTGFNSLHYFSKTFKKRRGVSPSEFARSCRLW